MLLRHRGHEPVVDPSAFVASTATLVGDVRVGPRARVMYGAVLDAEGARVEVGECAIVCEHAVLHAAHIGAGGSVAVGALVHGGTILPEEFFVPPNMIAIGDPVRVHPPADPATLGEAVRSTGFARLAFGVDAAWEDRITRYEQAAEVRSEEFAAHADDVPLSHDDQAAPPPP